MKKIILLILLTPIIVSAQNPIVTSNNRFMFDQVASDITTANSYIYKRYVDGSITGINLNSVTCSGTISPFVCLINDVPNFSQGTHNLQFTASNVAGESAKSSPFVFDFVAVPSSPSNIRIK